MVTDSVALYPVMKYFWRLRGYGLVRVDSAHNHRERGLAGWFDEDENDVSLMFGKKKKRHFFFKSVSNLEGQMDG